MKDILTLNTVVKALRVLELISESKDGYTLTELARCLKTSMGGAQRLTNTLMALHYLYKEPRQKKFRLTPKIFSFGLSFLNQSEIRQIALPYMNKLNEELDEIVNLGVMISDEEIVYIERIDNTSHLKLTTNLRVGSRRPIHVNSIGQVILAFLSEMDQDRILDHLYSGKYTGEKLLSKNKLKEHLREIQKMGYSTHDSETFSDILALAAPILNHQGVPVGGINIVMPRTLPSVHIKNKYIPKLIETSKIISSELGHLQRIFS